MIALIGVKGRKDEKQNFKTAFIYMLTGLIFFFISYFVLLINERMTAVALRVLGADKPWLPVIPQRAAPCFQQDIRDRLSNDIFNRDNETFPAGRAAHRKRILGKPAGAIPAPRQDQKFLHQLY
jgi:hypothetical protein